MITVGQLKAILYEGEFPNHTPVHILSENADYTEELWSVHFLMDNGDGGVYWDQDHINEHYNDLMEYAGERFDIPVFKPGVMVLGT